MVKNNMYKEIQRLKALGYSKRRIGQELELDRSTVRKYFDMPPADYQKYRWELQNRLKVCTPYRQDILDLYEVNRNKRLNMAAVFDFLEEKHEMLPISEKTLRNYIGFLRKTGELKLNMSGRIFQKVPELAYGKQLQLDFGQYRCFSGLKVYIFAALLSASRYKYISFQLRSFKTDDVIHLLLDCFDCIGGLPQEIAIDQDRLMIVSENKGDIVYTERFGNFIREMDMAMFVCRKSDPQSKGKVENLVKYVKYNFFGIRDFENIDEANHSLTGWLSRRANGRISQASKKIPSEEIQEERKHLRPIRNSIFRKDSYSGREDRIVNDKGYIIVDSNSYQVPDIFKKCTVEVYITEFKVFVFDSMTGRQIAEHNRSALTGQSITNTDYRRQKQSKIEELKAQAYNLYADLNVWKLFIDKNFSKYKRYIRDQVADGMKHFKDSSVISTDILERSLRFCIDNDTLSFSNLHDTYLYFVSEDEGMMENQAKVIGHSNGNSLSKQPTSLIIQHRTIDEYKSIVEGGGI